MIDKFEIDSSPGLNPMPDANPSAAEAVQQPSPSFTAFGRDLKERSYTLEGMASQVRDHSSEIKNMIAERKSWQRPVKHLIIMEIIAATNGNIVIPNYNPNRNTKPEVLCYKKDHWEEVNTQEFYDLNKKCCEEIGLPDMYQTDASFMKGIYDDVAHALAHSISQPEHPGEVWINLQNGTLKVNRKGKITLDPHRRENFFRYVLPYSYDPAATCEKWHTVLDQIMPDHSLQDLLGEFMGYCFTNNVKAEKMLVLSGGGSNGKSVVMDTIEALMGSNNVSNVTLDKLTQDDKMRCELDNKLVNISSESNKELETSMLKILVSGEPVMAYKNYIGPRTLTNYAKLITSFNQLPKAEATHGFYRRFLIIPFTKTIKTKEQDRDLAKKLIPELPGILNWAIEGLQRFIQSYSFTESLVSEVALQNYRLGSDSVRLFVTECCETETATCTPGPKLYTAYKNYCLDTGIRYIGRNDFYKRLVDMNVVLNEYQRNKSFKIEIITDSYGNTPI